MLTWKDALFVFLQDFNYELLIPESVTNKQLFKFSKVKKKSTLNVSTYSCKLISPLFNPVSFLRKDKMVK